MGHRGRETDTPDGAAHRWGHAPSVPKSKSWSLVDHRPRDQTCPTPDVQSGRGIGLRPVIPRPMDRQPVGIAGDRPEAYPTFAVAAFCRNAAAMPTKALAALATREPRQAGGLSHVCGGGVLPERRRDANQSLGGFGYQRTATGRRPIPHLRWRRSAGTPPRCQPKPWRLRLPENRDRPEAYPTRKNQRTC